MSPFCQPAAGPALARVDTADAAYDDHMTVVEGVVSPASQGGWRGPSPAYDVHSFTLAGWRVPGGPFSERDLTLLRPVPPWSEGRGAEEMERFPAYSFQRFSVLLSTDRTRAVVEKALPFEEPDPELTQFAERLRQPVVVPTARFGDVVRDPRLGWFDGQADWNGQTIRLYLDPEPGGGIEPAIAAAERLWTDQADWKRRVDELVLRELLPLKNKSWLDDGESEVTAEEFAESITLTSITMRADGDVEFWHKDGGLFGGHGINARGNLTEGPAKAGIAG
jgi:hypothetical protein